MDLLSVVGEEVVRRLVSSCVSVIAVISRLYKR